MTIEIKMPWEKTARTRRKIPASVKQAVWAKYIGMSRAEGKCYVCKRTIHITDFELGHNRAISKGGSDKITNLRPICKSCNTAMGSMAIETYKQRYFSRAKKKVKRKIKRRKKSLLEKYLLG